jgi:hypothetical protein
MNRQHAKLIVRIEASGKDLLDYIAQLPAEEIHRVPAPDEWSIHAVVAHLRDTEEQVFLKRILLIQRALEPPAVENFDQVEWNRTHYSPDEPLKKIMADLRRARRKFLRALEKTPDREWSRCGLHPEYGKISVEWLAVHNYSHNLEHLHQMVSLRDRAILMELNQG